MAKTEPKILFEDSEILVIEKPAGLVVTPAASVKSPTLSEWLKTYLKFTGTGIGGRAGIVHRLDAQTSGVIVCAKNQTSFEFLQQQFAARLVTKKYLALVHGIASSNNFAVDLPIARQKMGKFSVQSSGKVASTQFNLIKKYQFGDKFGEIVANFPKKQHRYFQKYAKFYSLFWATPYTGRTHQIRVHAKSWQLPIVADLLYLPRKLVRFDERFCPRLFLHAAKITFTHPQSQKLVSFESKLPNDLANALEYLKEVNDAN